MAPQQWAAVVILFTFILVFPRAIEIAEWKACFDNKEEYKLLSPATLKRNTKMNWVGCVLTWIALGIVSPCMFIFKCIYNLFHI
jgi:hypothetical protein